VNYFILPILGTLMWTGKNLVLMFKGNNFAGFLATLGVSIKNLMRERERNVEQVF
jgi:hypothetical protein